MDAEATKAAKLRYAKELLKEPNDPFKAALAIFGSDTGSALRASAQWVNDEEVLAEKERLLEEKENGELDFLPSKADAARLAWKLANDSWDTEEKLKALRLYADIRAFIEKPSAVKVEQNNVVNNRVMVVKDHGTDDQWAEGLRKQQQKLKEEAQGNGSVKH